MDEWVEVEGKSVELAVDLAMAELGIESREEANIEVLREPKPSFLGLGGQDALVKVSKKPKSKRRRRRRKRSGKESDEARQPQGGKAEKQERPQSKGNPKNSRQGKPKEKPAGANKREESKVTAPETNIEDQATIAREFLEGLLVAFGLEGKVVSQVEDEMLILDVTGDQTEALVGQKGSILQAIHELTRTVIQRRTFRAPRMRLDVAGYTERRRAALKIFAGQVAEQVLEGGGEVMLEPMNPADRKVLHDAVGEIDGVRSYSEGQDPNRSVVIAPEEE